MQLLQLLDAGVRPCVTLGCIYGSCPQQIRGSSRLHLLFRSSSCWCCNRIAKHSCNNASLASTCRCSRISRGTARCSLGYDKYWCAIRRLLLWTLTLLGPLNSLTAACRHDYFDSCMLTDKQIKHIEPGRVPLSDC